MEKGLDFFFILWYDIDVLCFEFAGRARMYMSASKKTVYAENKKKSVKRKSFNINALVHSSMFRIAVLGILVVALIFVVFLLTKGPTYALDSMLGEYVGTYEMKRSAAETVPDIFTGNDTQCTLVIESLQEDSLGYGTLSVVGNGLELSSDVYIMASESGKIRILNMADNYTLTLDCNYKEVSNGVKRLDGTLQFAYINDPNAITEGSVSLNVSNG